MKVAVELRVGIMRKQVTNPSSVVQHNDGGLNSARKSQRERRQPRNDSQSYATTRQDGINAERAVGGFSVVKCIAKICKFELQHRQAVFEEERVPKLA